MEPWSPGPLVNTLLIRPMARLLLSSFYSFERLLMDFHWSLSNCKSPQISRTLLSIMADHNNVVFWIVFCCLLTFTNPLKIVPSLPFTTCITVILMFYSFFVSLQGLSVMVQPSSLNTGWFRFQSAERSAGQIYHRMTRLIRYLPTLCFFVDAENRSVASRSHRASRKQMGPHN